MTHAQASSESSPGRPDQTAAGPTEPTHSHGVARWIPILSWAPRYQRAWLRPDLIAGVAVAALVVPKSLGYAGIAGCRCSTGCTRRPSGR